IFEYYGNPTATDGFSNVDFAAQASNYTIGAFGGEEKTTGPMAYWKFDEGTGTIANDSSGGGKNATLGALTAAPIWKSDNDCVSGKCLAFDGANDYVSLPNDIVTVSNIRSKGVTYSAWIKTANNASEQRVIGQKQSSGYSDYSSGGIGISASGQARMVAYDDSGAYKYSNSTTILQANTWYFITGTYDPTDQKIRVYVNGNLEGSAISIVTFSRLIANNDNKIGISAHATTPYPFNGSIDEPKIYSYARSAAQIAMDYNAGLAGMGAKDGVANSFGDKSDKWMTDGLVSWWKMDEASWNGTAGEVADAGGNNLNGTAMNSATTALGKNGNGGNFNAGSYVDAGASTKFDMTNKLTVSLWFKSNSATQNAGLVSKWTTGAGTNNSFAFSLGADIGANRFGFVVQQSSGGAVINNTPTETYNVGEWTHLTGVADGKFVHVYKNGVEVGTPVAYDGTIKVTTKKMILGRLREEDAIYPFNGMLDDVRVYNRALSPAEVSQLASWTPTPTSKTPVGYWKMDEGSGDTINNSVASFSKYLGTKYNSTAWSNDGKSGKSLSFNGNTDQLIFANSSDLKYDGGDISLSVWVKPDATDDGGVIFSKPWNGSGQYNYRLNSSGGANQTISFYLLGATSWTLNCAQTISAGSWHHVEVVVNGTSKLVSFYVDGKFVNSAVHTVANWTPSSGDISLNAVMACIYPYGSNSCAGNTTLAYKGLIDEVKYYKYAQNALDVAIEYNQGKSVTMASAGISAGAGDNAAKAQYCVPGDVSTCNSPVAEWNFDEKTGAVAKDTSGNGTDAALVGSPLWTQGKTGSALKLDGSSQYLNMGDVLDMGTNSFTTNVWVKTTSTANTGLIGKSSARGLSGRYA
ncbi:MAG: LamG domain-containing protein, partial [Candidatus Moranbacteria bacterium]|nr:LamG domain-containing protein [Candidatus Moranbacteria bacterium]